MEEKLLVVSPFPPKNSVYGNPYSALAAFAQKSLDSLQKLLPSLKILVLADQIPESGDWQVKNLQVKRVWQRNKLSLYFHLLDEVFKNPDFKKILLQLEWTLFGKNPLLLMFLPLWLLFLKILGKKVFVVIHGVAWNFDLLAPQLAIKKGSFKVRVLSWGLKAFYFLVIKTAYKIIVLEQHFTDLINKKFNTNKAIFIPLGVDMQIRPMVKGLARKKIGLDLKTFLMVNFGFLTWYKGVDQLADAFLRFVQANPQVKTNLIFAGGESRAHRQTPAYQKFIKKIKAIVSQTDKMSITGFLPEKKIVEYYSAADLIVLPYRVFISSSGPLSLAFSFKKPVLLSEKLLPYLESPDISAVLKEAGLEKQELFVNFSPSNLAKKLNWLRQKKNLDRLEHFSQLMQAKRAWSNIGKQYLKLIFNQTK